MRRHLGFSIRRLPGARASIFSGLLVCSALILAVASRSAGAATASYVPISGAGSTWSQNAIDQWISDVAQYGMRINYAGVGSTTGREEFLDGTVDFAASDIPFQTKPDDGSAPENPVAGTYAYMPITAGGTVLMYNLTIDGKRVTNLRLSGENIAKIFTGEITNWDNPAIAADNPDLELPDEPIVPVVRSDGAGSSYEFSEWMISQYPSVWNSFCNASGRAPACGPTSFWPTVPGMIAQSGDLGVAGYVSQNYAAGAIGYVEYSYALNSGFPVAQMLNAAGYYTEPTAQNVAVSLLDAQIETQNTDPSVYLTENLQDVYTDPDPRTYPLSSYSYLILPITLQGQFSDAKGTTLAAFSYFAMCQGQQDMAELGYSPMPINLVEASFTQIARIPGANVQNINIQSCDNPTFTTTGQNLLAQTAPYPPACDKQGPTQCTTGTGGAVQEATPISNPVAKSTAPGVGAISSSAGSSSGTAVGAQRDDQSGPSQSCGPSAAACSDAAPGGQQGQAVEAATQGSAGQDAVTSSTVDFDPLPSQDTLSVTDRWSLTQTLVVVVVIVVVAGVIVPGILLARRRERRPL